MMATLEDVIKDLKEKNNELVQKVQYWKMTAADRENDKLNLMKEMNELRLKLSRLRNNSGNEARKLDTSLQQTNEKAISHLVKASTEIARGMEIAKAYIRQIQELDAESPRWSMLSGTPTSERTDKVHRVPPMMHGHSIRQPVVSLSRTLLNTSDTSTPQRSPNQNHSTTGRALPMYMLQDAYIPLTRIDIADIPNNNMDNDEEGNDSDNSNEEGAEDGEGLDDSGRMSEEDEFPSRILHALSEEDSDMEEIEQPRLTLRLDNPLEGPSWLLDSPPDSRSSNPRSGTNLEPDSTTEPDTNQQTTVIQKTEDNLQTETSSGVSVRMSCEFSPTVRRRKRTSSPPMATPRQTHYSPRPLSSRKTCSSGRVLKVLVAKMRLTADGSPPGLSSHSPQPTPHPQNPSPHTPHPTPHAAPKRARSPDLLLSFDAPSPNGATDSAVIVSETITNGEIIAESGTSHHDSLDTLHCRVNLQDSRRGRLSHEPQHRPIKTENCRTTTSQDSQQCSRFDSRDSHDSRDSDSGSGGGGDYITSGRTRRPRKMVTYKEKPLNRKLRR